MTSLYLEQVHGPHFSSRGRVLTENRLDGMCPFRVRPRSSAFLVAATKYCHRVMSVKGKKVLHIDRNDHYGGFVDFCTSLELCC